MRDLNPGPGSAFSAARWTVAGRGGRQLVRFAVSLVLARLVLPAEFGLMGVALVVVGFLDLIGDLGTGQAIIQRKTLSPSLLSSVFALNLAIGGVLALGMLLGADAVAAAYGLPEKLPAILRVLALGCVVTSATVVQRATLVRLLQFRRLATAELAGAVANAGVAVGMAWKGSGVWALVAGHLAGSAISSVLLFAFGGFRPGFQIRASDLREIAPYSLNLAAFNLGSYFLQNTDALIISRFLGADAMGYYVIAQRLIVLPMRALTQMMGGVLIPALARHQEDLPRLQRDVLRSCAGVAFVAFPVVAGLAIVAGPLVRVALGERWLPAVPIMVWLAPMALVLAPRYSIGPIYRAVGRTDWLLVTGLAVDVLRALACLLGALHSLEGLGLGLSVWAVTTFYPVFAAVFRLIDLRFSRLLRALGPVTAVTAAMSAAALATRVALDPLGVPPLAVLGATALVGGAVYLSLALWVRVPAIEDLRRLARLTPAGRAGEPREQASL